MDEQLIVPLTCTIKMDNSDIVHEEVLDVFALPDDSFPLFVHRSMHVGHHFGYELLWRLVSTQVINEEKLKSIVHITEHGIKKSLLKLGG